jgi:hypothetical protein
MAKKGKGNSGLLIAAGLGLAAFAVLRQGQAAATTLGTARLERFELKGLSGTSLKAVAHVQFSNTEVSRDTSLQALGMNVLYNDTVISTVHLMEPQTLPANQNTTVPVPMTLNLGSLFTQLALTGKIPSLASFKSVPALRTWLQDKISPESLQLQGMAKVDGLAVRFNNPLSLADYLPTAPRPGPVDQLAPRASRATATNTSSTALPRTLQAAPVATKAAPAGKAKAGRAGALVKRGATLVKQGSAIVRQASGVVRTIKQARPAAGARPTAGKVRRPTKPPRPSDGLPHINLPVSR